MLDFLFRRLTAEPNAGAALFDAATAEARRTAWYREGAVPDTLDGRFAVLSTVIALILVRLERDREAGNRTSVALTERFIEVMESEHRELGLGDPTLGKTVRKLVGSLARRVEMWRRAVDAECPWDDAVRVSMYKAEPKGTAIGRNGAALIEFWSRLDKADSMTLIQGRFE
jgi:cytochrome b pre-mRNA-processing protein 3